MRILKQFDSITGFPQVQWYGTEEKYNMVVTDLLGPSIEDLFEICGRRFSIKTIIMLVDQMVMVKVYRSNVFNSYTTVTTCTATSVPRSSGWASIVNRT